MCDWISNPGGQDLIKKLLDHGANVNQRCRWNHTPLAVVALTSRYYDEVLHQLVYREGDEPGLSVIEMVQYLIERGADPRAMVGKKKNRAPLPQVVQKADDSEVLPEVKEFFRQYL